MMAVWNFLASAGWSVLAGLTLLALLIIAKKHRDKAGKLNGAKITLIIVQGASLYTLVICILGNWLLRVPISETILNGFGNERIAWLMLGIAGDLFVRIYGMFDPE